VVVLGFGRIEEAEQQAIKSAITTGVEEGKSIDDVLEEWNSKADEYDAMPRGVAPQRYTRVYYFDNRLRYHHINREHPMSPDGWALLLVEEEYPYAS